MEGGNYDDNYGHNVWGGPAPQEVNEQSLTGTAQAGMHQSDQGQQWYQELYHGFKQQYELEASQIREEAEKRHVTLLEEAKQEWTRNSDNLKQLWSKEAQEAIALERTKAQMQLESIRSVFKQQLMDSSKEVAELVARISLLELEKAQALQGTESTIEQYRIRILDLEQKLADSKMEGIQEAERFESEIARIQLISDHRGREIQRLEQQVSDLIGQRSQQLSAQSEVGSMQERPRARTMASMDDDGSDFSSVASHHFQSMRSDSSGTVHRVNVLRAEGGSSNAQGKSKHKMPLFNAVTGFSAHQWLRQFEKLCSYYSWDERTALMEMEISMVGEADTWFLGLPATTRSSLTLAIEAFKKNFGGEASERAKALTALQSIVKGNEPMETFGPRIKTMILKVVPGENEFTLESHLSMLYPTLSEELVDVVSAQRPTTLTDAIDIATTVERGRSFANKGKGKGKKVTMVPIPTGVSSTKIGVESEAGTAMEVDAQQVNAQHFRGETSKYGKKSNGGSKGKTCYACKKPGHIAKDCYLVRQVKDMQNQKGKSYRSNCQQVTEGEKDTGGSNLEINNAELDITNNLFYQVGGFNSNSQILSEEDLIPTFVGGSNDPRSFNVLAEVTDGGITSCLMDTGAMMSSISEEEARRLGLLVQVAPRIKISYGNSSIEYSETCARFGCTIDGYRYEEIELRVVKKQNVRVILGMDWLLEMDVLLDPKYKALVQRSGKNAVVAKNNTMTIEPRVTVVGQEEMLDNIPEEIAAVLRTMPSLYDESEQQTITNAPIQHVIDTGDAAPVVRRRRRVSPKEDAVINEAVDALLVKGVLQPSKSAWCSTPLVVPKPDGTNRFVNNFRGVNAVTVKDKYPLPRMDDLIDQLANSSWYCTIDLKSAYFQIPLAESSRPKTAFATSKGFYEYTVMAQGLCNSPATFSRFMDHIMREVKSFTIVYLDDALCHARTKEECVERVIRVLKILNRWNLKISLKKCRFLVREVPFLGFIISGSGIKSNPDKVAPIQNWPSPSNVNELQQFLGICTFYHRYIANLSTIASPLYRLLKKDQDWYWNEECKKAFEQLKMVLKNLPELAYPDPNLPFELHCDASNFAMGAVLVQNGRPIAYASKTFSAAEKNYSTTEKECLAVAWSLEYFHCYVHGAVLTIYTDHAALKSILATKDPKGRISRWITHIWNYEFAVVHRKGVDNRDADALSRLELPATISSNSQGISKEGLVSWQDADPFIMGLKEKGKLVYPFMVLHDLVWYCKVDPPVVVVPEAMRKKFMEQIHCDMTSGHMGRDKTLQKAKDNGWWPTINQDVPRFVANCLPCRMHKTPTHKYKKLSSIEVCRPGEMWAADVAFLPLSAAGNRYLLIFMEYLTKWVVAVALPSFDANSIANVMMYSVILVHGHVERFLTDNGKNFIAEAILVMCHRLGMKKVNTSVEHPQTDGLVERMNRTMKKALSIYCEKDAQNWDVYLPFVTFAINTSKQDSTGYSPFEAMYGRQAKLPTLQDIPSFKLQSHTAKTWLAYLNHYIPLLHGDIRANIQRSQRSQQKYYNRGRKEKENFAIGDIVLKIKAKDHWKFPEPKFDGPYKVIEITGKNKDAYRLEELQESRSRQYKNKKTTTANIRDIYRLRDYE